MKKRLMVGLLAGGLMASMLPGVVSAASVPFTSCGSSTDAAQVTSVDVTPYPVSKGAVTTISLAGTTESRVKNQKADVDYVVSYFGIQLLTGTVGKAHFKEGPLAVSEKVLVPATAPSGTYALTVSAESKDLEPVLCVQVTVTIN